MVRIVIAILTFTVLSISALHKLQSDLMISEVGREPTMYLIRKLAQKPTMEAKYWAALHMLSHVKGNPHLTDAERKTYYGQAANTLAWVKAHAPGYQQVDYGLKMVEELKQWR